MNSFSRRSDAVFIAGSCCLRGEGKKINENIPHHNHRAYAKLMRVFFHEIVMGLMCGCLRVTFVASSELKLLARFHATARPRLLKSIIHARCSSLANRQLTIMHRCNQSTQDWSQLGKVIELNQQRKVIKMQPSCWSEKFISFETAFRLDLTICKWRVTEIFHWLSSWMQQISLRKAFPRWNIFFY